MRIKVDYKAVHLWKHYRKCTGKKFGGVEMTQAMHTRILMKFFDKLTDAMIFENADFTFPHHLGNWSIKKKKTVIQLNEEGKLDTSRLKVDYKATKELQAECPGTDKKVYHLNEHTNGYYYRYLWSKITCFVPNSTVYLLDIRRRHTRKLSNALMNPKNRLDFYELKQYKR